MFGTELVYELSNAMLVSPFDVTGDLRVEAVQWDKVSSSKALKLPSDGMANCTELRLLCGEARW
jgi:hypothetical protein